MTERVRHRRRGLPDPPPQRLGRPQRVSASWDRGLNPQKCLRRFRVFCRRAQSGRGCPVSVLVSVGFAILDDSCLLASRQYRYGRPVIIGVWQLLATQGDLCPDPLEPILSPLRLPVPPSRRISEFYQRGTRPDASDQTDGTIGPRGWRRLRAHEYASRANTPETKYPSAMIINIQSDRHTINAPTSATITGS